MKASVLIVEDEALVALEMQTVLERAGFAISGTTGSLEAALAMLDDRGCDVAVLDANLRGTSVEPLAVALRRRGKPFLFVSGYRRAHLPPQFPDAPLVAKPFEPAALIKAVTQLLS